MQAYTYSFLDVKATITGPGGAINIGSDAGAAEEGISADMMENKNTMTVGADGSVMHSLHGGNAGIVTIRLLKTSPINSQLETMYNFQRQSSTTWGQNVLRVMDIARGDVIAGVAVSFQKFPNVVYAKDGNVMEWVFDCADVSQLLGVGVPDVNVAA